MSGNVKMLDVNADADPDATEFIQFILLLVLIFVSELYLVLYCDTGQPS